MGFATERNDTSMAIDIIKDEEVKCSTRSSIRNRRAIPLVAGAD